MASFVDFRILTDSTSKRRYSTKMDRHCTPPPYREYFALDWFLSPFSGSYESLLSMKMMSLFGLGKE